LAHHPHSTDQSPNTHLTNAKVFRSNNQLSTNRRLFERTEVIPQSRCLQKPATDVSSTRPPEKRRAHRLGSTRKFGNLNIDEFIANLAYSIRQVSKPSCLPVYHACDMKRMYLPRQVRTLQIFDIDIPRSHGTNTASDENFGLTILV